MSRKNVTVPNVLRAETVVRRIEAEPGTRVSRTDAAALRKLVEQHYTLIGVLALVQSEVSAVSKQHINRALKRAGVPVTQ